MIALVFYT